MATAAAASANTSFIADCVKSINAFRSIHQVAPLTHNVELSTVAQKWADHLAAYDTFGHNPDAKYRDERLGENCAMKWTSDKQDFTGTQVADQWYGEVQRYDFKKNSGPSTGHFTQLVWKSSREIGVGRSQTREGKWLVVANFFPAGNQIGRNAENVLPPRDGKVPHIPGNTQQKKEPLPVSVVAASTPTTAPLRSSPTAAAAAVKTPPNQTTTTTTITKSRMMSTKRKSNPTSQAAAESTVAGTGGSVKKEVRTETTGTGANAVTKVITVETRTMPDGSVETTTTEEVTRNVRRSSVPNGPNGNSGNRPPVVQRGSMQPRRSSVGSTISNASTSAVPQSTSEFIAEVIKAHNVVRNKHGKVTPLVHNEDLTVQAQRWATHLASIRGLQHNQEMYHGQPVGQNVAAKSSSAPTDYTGQEVVDQWYSEIAKYDYSNPEGKPGVTTGHFTQVVWKGSREIGVGKAKSSDGREAYVCCNYFPAGNYLGRFKDNVLPAK